MGNQFSPAPIPEDEYARLRELDSYEIIDTDFEQSFDDLTQIASKICNTPISLISLLDSKRQWFKSRVGLEATETAREISFCQYAILQNEVYEVSNALESEIFVENPLVQGEPHIRFYAGAPLNSPQGHQLGTLCVIDTEPKKLNNNQKEALKSLARQVVFLLELRKKTKILDQTNKELARSNEDLDQFAYIASHDLKSPLRAITNYSQWIIEDAGDCLPDPSREHLEKLNSRAMSMQVLLNDLLAYSKVGRMDEITVPVNTKKLVSNLADLIDHPDEFQIIVDDDLPSIESEKTPLSLVFRNLISNAVDHHDREDGIIKVCCKVVGNWCEFEVRDDGPGIPPEHHDKIFEMFQSLSRSTGSGMGLAMVKKVVEDQGGTVSLDSIVGEGSKFKFTWPFVPSKIEEPTV